MGTLMYNGVQVPLVSEDSSDANAVASDLLDGKTAYSAGTKKTGTIPTYAGGNTITSNGTVAVAGKYCANDLTVNVSGSGGETCSLHYGSTLNGAIAYVDAAAGATYFSGNGSVNATVPLNSLVLFYTPNGGFASSVTKLGQIGDFGIFKVTQECYFFAQSMSG